MWQLFNLVDGGPPIAKWIDVSDGTRSGAELKDGVYLSDIRVAGLQEDADTMLRQFLGSKDFVTTQYVICNRSKSLHQSYGGRLVVQRTSQDPFYCNGPSECQSGADEMCWQVDSFLTLF